MSQIHRRRFQKTILTVKGRKIAVTYVRRLIPLQKAA